MIGIMLGTLLAAAEPSAENPDRAQLEEIYQRPEFARARQRNQGTIEQLIRRLRAWLGSFFESHSAETYSVVTRFLVLLAASLVGGWAVLRFLSSRQRQAATKTTTASHTAAPVLEDAAAHLKRARAVLATDSRAALREGLLALLSMLERQRLARPDRVKTNRELARELSMRGAAPELAKTVAQLMGWYDRAFYSLETVAVVDAARFLDDVERLT